MFSKRFGRHFALLFMLGLCRLASAHPMGNFSVNHYSRIDLQSDRVIVRYFIDLAEIPTYQELQQGNIAATPMDPNSAAVVRYVAARGAELGHGLILDIDGTQIPMRLVSSGVIFPPGAGGLPTMKMGFVYEAVYPPASSITDRQHATVHYVDNNYPGHSGWKEIVALASAGSLLRTSVPSTDRSGELSNYPTDLLTSPPQCLEASLVAALPPVVDAQSHIISKPLSRRVETSAASATLPQNHPNTVVNAVPAHRQTAAVPVAMSLEPAQSAPAQSTPSAPQASRERAPSPILPTTPSTPPGPNAAATSREPSRSARKPNIRAPLCAGRPSYLWSSDRGLSEERRRAAKRKSRRVPLGTSAAPSPFERRAEARIQRYGNSWHGRAGDSPRRRLSR